MSVKELREKARAFQVKNYSRLTREQLIRAIQLAEGNTDCFGKIQACGQMDCCWRSDCQV